MDSHLLLDKGVMRDMAFIDAYYDLRRPNEEFTLLKKGKGQKDKIGDFKDEWIEVQELRGLIQRRQTENIDESGSKSRLRYKGYFIPDFIIKTNNFDDYRIKYSNGYETLYLRIKVHNPNLYDYKGELSHYEIEFVEDKKHA